MSSKFSKHGVCFFCEHDTKAERARPQPCTDHWFHRKCLNHHAQRNAKCPFDFKPFRKIICEDGREIKVESDSDSDDEGPSFSMPRFPSGSGPDDFRAFMRQAAFMGSSPLDDLFSMFMKLSFRCDICHSSTPEERAMPKPCRHIFHRHCLTKHVRSHDVDKCPKDGCQREFDTILCQGGDCLKIQKRQKAKMSDDAVCDLCHSSRSDERARPESCSHEFHRTCLLKHAGKENLCPKEGCRREFDTILCQNGNGIGLMPNPMIQTMYQMVGDSSCKICRKKDASRMPTQAKPCGCHFHRGCLIEACRENRNCPACKEKVEEICPMIGDDIRASSLKPSMKPS